ncbi:hypothetical protein ACLB1G_10360 [Oxalobacteraceae bacterium A2-2]
MTSATRHGSKASRQGSGFPDRELPRDANGAPLRDPEAEGAYSQLGQKDGRYGKYDQARVWDTDGRPIKDIDFTDHGRPGSHTNPHEHRYVPNPTGGTAQHGPAQPLRKEGGDMAALTVPMYRANGTRVQLADLLRKIPANDWVWSIVEFDGVGKMPAPLSFGEFQRQLHEQPTGLLQTWSEVCKFAKGLEYTIDCLVVAVLNIDRLTIGMLENEDFQQCEVALRAIDSTEWEIFSSHPSLLDELKRVAS